MIPDHSFKGAITILATEILSQICKQLCPHCCCPPFTKWPKSETEAAAKALAALCSTSKTLRSIAEPILYHRPYKIRSLPKFARTLQDRPDLASCVRELRCHGDGWYLEVEDDLDFCKDVARTLQLDIPGDPDLQAATDGDGAIEQFSEELAIALIPKLEALTMSLQLYHESAEDTTNKFLAARFAKLGDKPGLSHLRALRLETEDYWGYGLTKPAVNVLLGAAPELEHLVLRRVRSFCKEDREDFDGRLWSDELAGYRNLRTLDIASSAVEGNEMELAQLRHIIQLSSRLEGFRFHALGPWIGEDIESHMPPSSFVAALELCREMLSVLDLDLSDSNYWFSHDSPDSAQLTGSVLHKFTRLEVLRLDEASFCRHWFREQRGGHGEENCTCLTDIVGPSVRSLVVKLDKDWHALGDIILLGEQVNRGLFPALQRLEVQVKNKKTNRHPDQTVTRQGRLEFLRGTILNAFEGTHLCVSVTSRNFYHEEDDLPILLIINSSS